MVQQCKQCGQQLFDGTNTCPSCNHHNQVSYDHILFGRYQIVSQLGQGGMGKVFLAKDLKLEGKLWAIKQSTMDLKYSQQFIDEAKILVKIDHPNMPKIVDFYPPDEDGQSFLVMDYIKGKTLAEWFQDTNQSADVNEIIKFAIQICDVLGYLHNQQPNPIIYRDLKPQNIMVGDHGEVKLIDFGIARKYKEGQQSDTVQIGTVGFAAPEQFESMQTDHRTDLFSLGAMLYFLLSNGKYLLSTQRPLKDMRDDLPIKLCEIIDKLVQFDPNKRYQSALEVKKDLQNIHTTSFETTTLLSTPALENNKDSNNKANVEQSFIKSQKIGFVNLTMKAGSSFITTNLAKALAENSISVSVLEYPVYKLGKTHLFDMLGIELSESEKHPFTSVPHLIKENNFIDKDSIFQQYNIDWLVTDSRKDSINNFSYDQLLKFMYTSRSSITLLDIGSIDVSANVSNSIKEMIYEMDYVFVVIDPLPQEIFANQEIFNFFEDVQQKSNNIVFIFNRWNDGINTKMLGEMGIDLKKSLKVPYIDPMHVYRAHYQCQIPYEDREVREVLTEPIQQIINIIAPNINLQHSRTKKSFFSKLISR
ncbi:serine/threonine-protein kinase [Cytobacillus sp. IB215316]|uniref:serine/threonine protein kinase n=1 Tax=Cytobacillus sp. IB215316 TaxID=3097354 RepID=UPI002A0D26D6|nr:serine/threonine-protein kinase [Cytobacillus sp. IB215316]MDX8360756.1 serine/threonine-protein kinase [Cytobacillus sp. IB215316]